MGSLKHSGAEGKRECVRPCEGSQTTIVVVWQVDLGQLGRLFVYVPVLEQVLFADF